MDGKVTAALQQAGTYEQAFHTLRKSPFHGGESGFICMQHLTDLGYADGILHPSFTENDFIWPGPGCCMGVEKAQGLTRRATTQEVQDWLWRCRSKQDKAFAAFGLVPTLLNGRRPPSLSTDFLKL